MVENKVPELTQIVTEASSALGLKKHFVRNGRFGDGVEIASCVDLEGHLGKDKRFYLLDFSRALPPDHKEDAPEWDTHWPFYRMMRAEFAHGYGARVSSGALGLSADAFTSFQTREGKENNAEVRQASAFLRSSIVARVARAISAHIPEASLSCLSHREGLNMRYLVVYDCLATTTEMDKERRSICSTEV